MLAIILHISVRELERQLLSQPAAAVDNDAGHLKLGTVGLEAGAVIRFSFFVVGVYLQYFYICFP